MTKLTTRSAHVFAAVNPADVVEQRIAYFDKEPSITKVNRDLAEAIVKEMMPKNLADLLIKHTCDDQIVNALKADGWTFIYGNVDCY